MSETEHYKFKKGDTLESIAKAHGIKSADEIWKLPDNKGLVSKRKKPDALQPNDDLILPPSEQKKKAEKDAAAKSVAAITATLTLCLKSRQAIDAAQTKIEQNRVQTTKELLAIMQHARQDAKGIDFAATVLTGVGTSITGLYRIAQKSAVATGAELVKLNKEAVKTGLEMTYAPLKTAWDQGMLGMNGAGGAAIEAVSEAASWLDNLSSPSWWAGKIAGKPEDAITKLVLANNATTADFINRIKVKREAIDSQLASLGKIKKQAEAHLKELH